jgi:uncharacterized protein YndB with AHSA1/START domain
MNAIMQDQNFATSFVVDQTPTQVFAAITNTRAWWSEEIVGRTDQVDAEFDYHFRDVHRCRIKVTELVPNKRVVWRVLKNHFSFIADQTEWTGTDIVFDIAERDGKTELRFTHIGLVPTYECYEVCADGWNTYINMSLRNLIAVGEGQPNLGEPMTEGERTLTNRDYTTSFTVDQTPAEVFVAINDIRAWWTGDIVGEAAPLGATFTYTYEKLHRSTQKVIALDPGKNVVWHVTDSELSFVDNKTEWTGTDIVFDIMKRDGKTEVRFTHRGLTLDNQCYGDCSNAWGFYIGRLRNLITTGRADG